MSHGSETRRAAVRIASSYVRLFLTVTLGLYLARVLLQATGNYGFGLIALLGSTTGLAAIIEQVAGWSMIRELGTAHHSNDELAFRRMLSSALIVSMAGAMLVLVLFAIIIAFLPLMNIAEDLSEAAQWFVAAKAIETAALVLLTPQFNMYLITERMAAYNFWLVIRRAVGVLGAVSLFWLNQGGDPARGIILYGWMSCGFVLVMIAMAVGLITLQDRRLVPRFALANKPDIWAILRISGWNLATQSAVTLALPLGAIIMNVAFGLNFGNLVFGFSMRLAGYTRMLASGMTVGLDAVSTRLTSVDRHSSVVRLVQYSTALHGFVIFPAVMAVALLAEPMIEVWIGTQVTDPEEMIPRIAALVQIMLLGFLGMCLTDCWTRILYGAGHIRSYAVVIIVGNALMPLLSWLFLTIFPEDLRYTAVGCAFSIVYLGVFGVIIPHRMWLAFGIPIKEVVRPLWRPLVASIVCVPVLMNFISAIEQWNLGWLALAVGAYGTAYVLLSWFFTFARDDRVRIASALAQLRANVAGYGSTMSPRA